jgi:phosphatidylserine decarboxylase
MNSFLKSSFALLLGLCLWSMVNGQTNCPPVRQLDSLYRSNKSFKSIVDSMLVSVCDLPGGTPNPWKNKKVGDLYQFFNKWFYQLPSPSNSFDNILEFSFLYYRNPYGLRFVREEPGLGWTLYFSQQEGKFMDSPESMGSIPSWLSDSSLGNSDYIVPAGGYHSFNDFFSRHLKPGARPIASYMDNSIAVAPVDGTLNWVENDLLWDSSMATKGRLTLNLRQIFDGSPIAKEFVGGTALSFFLLPDNYHHFHAPVSGVIVESREMAGKELFGTQVPDLIGNGNPGQHLDFSIFENYKHGYFIIKTKNYGYVAVVPFGLETIGSVMFLPRFKNIGSEHISTVVNKGEDLGYFQYGGSLVMVFFQKGRFKKISIRQGERIGRLTDLVSQGDK